MLASADRTTEAQSACLAGTYQPNSGQESCLTADAGYFVASEAAQQQTECALGSYQPDSGQTACLLADAGYYVDTTAATSQTACPSGTTSPQGSDSIDDCTATTATLTIAKITDPPGGTDFPFTLDPGAVTFADKWGSNGIGQGDFNGPFGVAVDGDGNGYVADTSTYCVSIEASVLPVAALALLEANGTTAPPTALPPPEAATATATEEPPPPPPATATSSQPADPPQSPASRSQPMKLRPSRLATAPVVPVPKNGSSTTSPGLEALAMMRVSSASGFCVGGTFGPSASFSRAPTVKSGK